MGKSRVNLNKRGRYYNDYEIPSGGEEEFLKMIEAIKDSCMICGRLFNENEKRIRMPLIEKTDVWIKAGLVDKRYICSSCYRTMKKSKIKIKVSP